MIKYTARLDRAIQTAAKAHGQENQHRKGSNAPYIIHPFGVMAIASNVTDDEDVLVACLLHDVLEDVDSDIYSEEDMRLEYGDRVVEIVKDVTNDASKTDWHERSRAYLDHLEKGASDEAVIVSGSDKVHNLLSIVEDYKVKGDDLWQIFTTKSKDDQIWWYESILEVLEKRNAPSELVTRLQDLIAEAKSITSV